MPNLRNYEKNYFSEATDICLERSHAQFFTVGFLCGDAHRWVSFHYVNSSAIMLKTLHSRVAWSASFSTSGDQYDPFWILAEKLGYEKQFLGCNIRMGKLNQSPKRLNFHTNYISFIEHRHSKFSDILIENISFFCVLLLVCSPLPVV